MADTNRSDQPATHDNTASPGGLKGNDADFAKPNGQDHTDGKQAANNVTPLRSNSAMEGVETGDADEPYPDLPSVEASLGLEDEEVDTMEEVVDTSIQCRKPRKGEIFRTHPNPEMTATAWVFVDADDYDKDFYLPTPEMRPAVKDLLKPVRFFLCQNTKGEMWVWAIGTNPPGRKRKNKWNETAEKAARMARKNWTSISANDDTKSYTIFRDKKENRPDPVWPEEDGKPLTILQVLSRVFVGNHLVDTKEHWIMKEHGNRVAVTEEDD